MPTTLSTTVTFHRIQLPHTTAYGVFDREFDLDFEEWICFLSC